jgi:tRNA U34 5-methylaminomethyl-2-thiouridine-forming methyltransferase MnmC
MNEEKPRLLETDDGSITIFHPEYEQAMHTHSGAYTESLVKHINPSRLLEKIPEGINVLDVGFGMGYNILALLHEAANRRLRGRINVISLERDRSCGELIEKAAFNDERDSAFTLVKKAFFSGAAFQDDLSVSVLFGDARRTISSIRGMSFDAVFHDPFSPSKNPELWTVEIFRILHDLMKEDAILTTYSSALQARSAMMEAGLLIGKGPSMGMKREGTLASRGRGIALFDKEELELMLKDRKAAPYRDPGLHDDRETITERRRLEMRLRS